MYEAKRKIEFFFIKKSLFHKIVLNSNSIDILSIIIRYLLSMFNVSCRSG